MLGKIATTISIVRALAARTRHAKAVALLVCVAALGAVGFGLGQAGGRVLMRNFLTAGGRIAPLLYRPSFQYFATAAMLGSPDELKRLAGYYALLETDSIGVDFLIERYGMESSIVNRRTIVWVIGFSRDTRRAADACAALYKSAPREIRKEILKSMKRLNEGIYRDFIKNLGKGSREMRR